MSGRSPALTRKDVWQECDRLKDEGHSPTVARLEERLQRGSRTTILKHLQSWKEGPGTTRDAGLSMMEEMTRFSDRIRQELQASFDATVEKERAEKDALSDEIEGLRSELEQAQHLSKERETEFANLAREAKSFRGQRDLERVARAGAERLASESKRDKQSKEDEIARLLDSLATADRHLAEERAGFQRLADDFHDVRKMLADTETRLAGQLDELVRRWGEDRSRLESDISAVAKACSSGFAKISLQLLQDVSRGSNVKRSERSRRPNAVRTRVQARRPPGRR